MVSYMENRASVQRKISTILPKLSLLSFIPTVEPPLLHLCSIAAHTFIFLHLGFECHGKRQHKQREYIQQTLHGFQSFGICGRE